MSTTTKESIASKLDKARDRGERPDFRFIEAKDLTVTMIGFCADIYQRVDLLEQLRDAAPDKKSKEKFRDEINRYDIALARGLVGIIGLFKGRLKQSQCPDLFFEVGTTLNTLCKKFPVILDSYLTHFEGELDDPCNLLAQFAETIINLTEKLEELAEMHPKAFRPVARDYPYWPMLHCRHKRATNHFDLLADRIELGRDCVIRSSDRANYSLKTPVTGFVWRALNELDSIHRIIDQTPSNQTPTQFLQDHWDWFFEEKPSEKIIMISLASHKLKPLRRSNVNRWAEEVILPYTLETQRDLRQVEAFKSWDLGPHGKRYSVLKKPITQALQSLARRD